MEYITKVGSKKDEPIVYIAVENEEANILRTPLKKKPLIKDEGAITRKMVALDAKETAEILSNSFMALQLNDMMRCALNKNIVVEFVMSMSLLLQKANYMLTTVIGLNRSEVSCVLNAIPRLGFFTTIQKELNARLHFLNLRKPV
jgi:hypothetical protein